MTSNNFVQHEQCSNQFYKTGYKMVTWKPLQHRDVTGVTGVTSKNKPSIKSEILRGLISKYLPL